MIGKRVADAVAAQDDLERGLPIDAALANRALAPQFAEFSVVGSLDDLLPRVVVDCTPKKTAAANNPADERAGVRAIFQGGESHDLAELSFVAIYSGFERPGHQNVIVTYAQPDGAVTIAATLGTPGAHDVEQLAKHVCKAQEYVDLRSARGARRAPLPGANSTHTWPTNL